MALLADLLLSHAAFVLWLRHRLLGLGAQLKRATRRLRRFATTLVHLGFPRPSPTHGWRRGGHNRTPASVEADVCRLHVERPDLGLRGLRVLMMRVKDVALSPSTVRAILLRSEALLAQLRAKRKKVPRSIRVRRKLALWGIDFTLVWVLGIVPVWLLGIWRGLPRRSWSG